MIRTQKWPAAKIASSEDGEFLQTNLVSLAFYGSRRTNLIYLGCKSEGVAWKDMRDRKIPLARIDSFYGTF